MKSIFVKAAAGSSVAAVATLASLPSAALGEHADTMRACSAAVAQVLETPIPNPGWLSPASPGAKPYRIELTDAKGHWEFQCDPISGALTSIEWTGNQESPLQVLLTVPAEEAVAQVKNRYPDSRIEEISHRLEAGGLIFYEFDVTLKDGTRHEVDVDATSGALASVVRENGADKS